MRKQGLIAVFVALASTSAAFAVTQIPEEVTRVRDPFKRPNAQIQNEKPRSDLEIYPVDKFKLVAVITGPKRLRAMLVGPNGKSYFVSEGMAIGFRKGVIRKITHQALLIREEVLNVLGQEENVDSELKLAPEGNNVGEINAPIREKSTTAQAPAPGANSNSGNSFVVDGNPNPNQNTIANPQITTEPGQPPQTNTSAPAPAAASAPAPASAPAAAPTPVSMPVTVSAPSAATIPSQTGGNMLNPNGTYMKPQGTTPAPVGK